MNFLLYDFYIDINKDCTIEMMNDCDFDDIKERLVNSRLYKDYVARVELNNAMNNLKLEINSEYTKISSAILKIAKRIRRIIWLQ